MLIQVVWVHLCLEDVLNGIAVTWHLLVHRGHTRAKGFTNGIIRLVQGAFKVCSTDYVTLQEGTMEVIRKTGKEHV